MHAARTAATSAHLCSFVCHRTCEECPLEAPGPPCSAAGSATALAPMRCNEPPCHSPRSPMWPHMWLRVNTRRGTAGGRVGVTRCCWEHAGCSNLPRVGVAAVLGPCGAGGFAAATCPPQNVQIRSPPARIGAPRRGEGAEKQSYLYNVSPC